MTAALGAWGKGHRCDALRKNHLRSQRVKPDSVARIPSTWTVFMLRQEDCCDFKASLHTEKCFLKYTREQTSSRRSRRVWLVKSLSLGPIPLQECHVCDAGLCSLEIMHPLSTLSGSSQTHASEGCWALALCYAECTSLWCLLWLCDSVPADSLREWNVLD